MKQFIGGGVNTEYVDLGLPSRLKWAKCNIGAKTETDYGYYFQWGDIKNKSNAECSWATYKHCNDTGGTLTKYNDYSDSSFGTVDNKTTLETVDDAAAQIMGGDWRMPTWSECQELINNTTNIWVANYNDTGVNGRKFTGPNGNSIFIPASGFRDGLMVYDREYYGYIWSSSLYRLPSTAYKLYFKSKNICAESESPRRLGLPVRGVFK